MILSKSTELFYADLHNSDKNVRTVEIEIELDPDRMVVLSLKPRFAEAILTGVKTVELRRTEPKIETPTLALLYAASPMRSLVGTCIVTSVRSADLVDLWHEHGQEANLSYLEFQQYFKGVDAGTALTLAEPRAFNQRVPLQDLRAKREGFRPPQSFAYVDAQTGDRFIQMSA